MKLTVQLMGGLGNQLFQAAFADSLSKSGYDVKLYVDSQSFKHSSQIYLTTVLQHWHNCQIFKVPSSVVLNEVNLSSKNWIDEIDSTNVDKNIIGYFQDFQYVTSCFISKLQFSPNILMRYPTIQNTVFLHIRGGDYVNHHLHDVNLDNYYKKAISLFPKGTEFSVFTNDREYALTKSYLKDIHYTFIESENEVDDLYLMSKCKGGICANSSFSWWGAYLNSSRQLVLPSKWINGENTYKNGYYFPGCISVDV